MELYSTGLICLRIKFMREKTGVKLRRRTAYRTDAVAVTVNMSPLRNSVSGSGRQFGLTGIRNIQAFRNGVVDDSRRFFLDDFGGFCRDAAFGFRFGFRLFVRNFRLNGADR